MSNYDIIAQFFRSKGYDANAIYGILGNARDESNGSPTAYSGQPGTGYGVFQWMPGGRWDTLRQWAGARGMDPMSLQAQLEFTWHEIQTGYQSMLPSQLNGKDPASAALEWASTFEGASQSNWQQRANYAEQFASSYKIPGGAPNFGAGSGGGANLGLPAGEGNMPTPTAADYTSALGSLGGLLNSVPELKNILNQAVKGGWNVTKFQQAIEGTHWYRTHSDTARQAIALQASDPATYNQNLIAAENNIRTQAGQLGVNLWGAELQFLAHQSIMEGWDSQTLQQNIAKQFLAGERLNKGAYAGQAAQIKDQIDQIATNYGIPQSPSATQSWVSSVLTGNTVEAYKEHAIQVAKSIYRGVAGRIDANTDVKTIADPYVQTMANTLELDPNSITWNNNGLIKAALTGSTVTDANASNKGATEATPLWQFEQQLRSDPRWQFTQNAHQVGDQVLHQIGQDWGLSI